MDRGRLLVALCLVCLSLTGCLDSVGTAPDEPTNTPTASPSAPPTAPSTPSPIGTPTEFPVVTPPVPAEYDIEIPDCPEWPASLSSGSVAEYTARFERAYVSRDYLQDTYKNVTYIGVSADRQNVTRTDGGWFVHLSVTGPAVWWREETSNRTRHADPPAYTASYFVTDGVVLRSKSTSADDPCGVGSRVVCPPR